MLKKELIVIGMLTLSSTTAFAPTTQPQSSPDMHMFQAAWQKRLEQSAGNTFLHADAKKQAKEVSIIINNAADGKIAPERMKTLGLVDEKGQILSGPALKARAAFLDQASDGVKINPIAHAKPLTKATIHPADHPATHARSPLRPRRSVRSL